MTKPTSTPSKNESEPNVPADSFEPLQQLQSLEIDPDNITTEEFLKCIQGGIHCWELAGHILVKLYAKEKLIFHLLIKENPWLTIDILHAFFKIGQGKLYPQVMLLRKCAAEQHLLAAPYEVQRKLCNEQIEVVIGVAKGKPVIEKRWLRELGKETAKLVFNNGKIRSTDQQIERLREMKAEPKGSSYSPETLASTRKEPTTSMASAFAKKLVSLGCWFVSFKGGIPELKKHEGSVPLISQSILLSEGQDEMVAIVELKHWVK